MSVQEVLVDPAASAPRRAPAELGVLYEHPAWFDRLFAELDRRDVHYHKLLAPDHFYDPGGRDPRLGLVFNWMSPSADLRNHGSGILYTQSWIGHLETLGTRVINGSKAFRYETSKALQLSLLHSLGLPFPKARVLHNPKHAVEASEGLRFPVVVKPNVGGSGAGIVRFDSRDQLAAAVNDGQIALGYDHVGLVQEFIPARGGHITRVETLAGKYLYAIQAHLTGYSFGLCAGDI